MTIKEFYDCIGGNYETALSRLMRDSLVEKFILKFVNDPSFGELKTAVEAGDWDAAFAPSHTLKGVALNLAFMNLGTHASELCDALRPQNAEARNAEVQKAQFAVVCDDYAAVIAALERYQAEKQ